MEIIVEKATNERWIRIGTDVIWRWIKLVVLKPDTIGKEGVRIVTPRMLKKKFHIEHVKTQYSW